MYSPIKGVGENKDHNLKTNVTFMFKLCSEEMHAGKHSDLLAKTLNYNKLASLEDAIASDLKTTLTDRGN